MYMSIEYLTNQVRFVNLVNSMHSYKSIGLIGWFFGQTDVFVEGTTSIVSHLAIF